jgi:hypothetical protein
MAILPVYRLDCCRPDAGDRRRFIGIRRLAGSDDDDDIYYYYYYSRAARDVRYLRQARRKNTTDQVYSTKHDVQEKIFF